MWLNREQRFLSGPDVEDTGGVGKHSYHQRVSLAASFPAVYVLPVSHPDPVQIPSPQGAPGKIRAADHGDQSAFRQAGGFIYQVQLSPASSVPVFPSKIRGQIRQSALHLEKQLDGSAHRWNLPSKIDRSLLLFHTLEGIDRHLTAAPILQLQIVFPSYL